LGTSNQITARFGSRGQYRVVEFIYAGPNEWKFDGNGDPVAPGARDLAESLRRQLTERQVSASQIEQHGFYGWGFNTQFKRHAYYNVLNPADRECYLSISMNWFLLQAMLLRSPHAHFDCYCETVELALQSLPMVSGIAWGRNLPKL
jgi:hypothetical protein